MTAEIVELLNTKQKTWLSMSKKERKNRTVREEYNRLCKRSKKTIKKVVLEYERELASRAKHDPKLVYAYFNSKRTTKEAIRVLEDESGQRVVERKDICDVLNRQFSSVFTLEDDDEFPAIQPRSETRLNAETVASVITKEKIVKCLAGLCPNKSMGDDGVHPSVLRYCAEALAPALVHIFKLSIAEGRIPDEWRRGNVTGIYKKGSRSDPANYRPVSLTSVLCKVMEGLVREVMMQFLVTNRLLAPEQHGFIPRKACVTNLLETIESVTAELSNGRPVDLIYLDFAKAFDTVPHKRLLLKLKAYGIDENLCAWVSDFLRDRKQRVVMGE